MFTYNQPSRSTTGRQKVDAAQIREAIGDEGRVSTMNGTAASSQCAKPSLIVDPRESGGDYAALAAAALI